MEDFGPYRIIRRIATGGMAEVFLARQRGLEGLERTVVIKRMLPHYGGNEEFITMFLDEARLLAGLSHPNIAQVLDLGQIEDSYYLVMEHVRGPTLGTLMQAADRSGQGPLPQKQALGIALDIAEALAYLHDRRDELGRPLDIVHRDLNPANVIVAYTGAVKLIDFGIAKAATKVHETRTGVIKGTEGYIAPEQHRATAKVDHRADIYALGVLLYEMLVGRHPFLKKLTDRVDGHKPPSELVPSISGALDRLVGRCLERDPADRPSDVRALIRELAHSTEQAGFVVTMSDIADMVHGLVPDSEGPTPLRPLRSSGASASRAEQSATVRLPAPEHEGGARTRVQEDGDGTIELNLNPVDDASPNGLAIDPQGNGEVAPLGSDIVEDDDAPTMHKRLPEARGSSVAGSLGSPEPVGDVDRDASPSEREPTRPAALDEVVSPTATDSDSSIATAPRKAVSGAAAAVEASRSATAGGGWFVDTEAAPRPADAAKASKDGGGVRRALSVAVRRLALVATLLLVAAAVGSMAFFTTRALRHAHQSDADEGGGPAEPPVARVAAASRDAAAQRTKELHVLSEPSGATVAVNGRVVGVAPVRVRVPQERRRLWVRVSLDGYVTAERPVQATAGEARFVLERLRVDAATGSP